ncbi:MAG: metallophosphoesterase [Deltaproteobacteria bacterium]|nr:metallophosphoesterase [Deltaproteobacteria bacterium]
MAGFFILIAVAWALATIVLARALAAIWPDAWARWIRVAFTLHVVAMASIVMVMAVSSRTRSPWLPIGLGLFIPFVASFGALLATSPIWATLAVWSRPARNDDRRRFLRASIATIPLASAGSGPAGAVSAYSGPVLRRIEISFASLPPELDGLKILQISDVHLGPFVGVDQVERAVALAAPHRPDLVALTGDIADDYEKLLPALRAIERLEAPLGAFAIFGNHENARGRDAAARIYAKTRIRLLVREGVLIDRAGKRIWLGGGDDPMGLGDFYAPYLEKTAALTDIGCPDDVSFKVMLTHRPLGWHGAKGRGYDLTLAGHTHGLQVAAFGRSIFEPWFPEESLLGLYWDGEAALYTTAGLGHWIPFRLNCPTEVPLIVLRRPKPRER